MNVNVVNYSNRINYCQNHDDKTVQLYSKFGYNRDWYVFSSLKTSANDNIEVLFDKVVSQQGFVGKTCDKIKNKFNLKNGSDNVKKIIEEYKKGLVSADDAKKAVDSYIKSHKKVLDFFADWGSAIAGAATFSILSAAAPIPVVGAMMLAGAGGAAFKVLFKEFDAKTGSRNYNTYGYDMTTGFINGMLSPVVNGISNWAMKNLAKKFGIKAIAKPVKIALKIDEKLDIDKLLTEPKLKLEGALLKKLYVLGLGNAIKGISKFGLSQTMRELSFRMQESKMNSMAYKSAVLTRSLFTPEEAELLNKKYVKSKDNIKNDVYNVEG